MKVSYKLILTFWVSLAKQNFTHATKYFSFATIFVCSILMQNIQIFYGGPVMFVVTCYGRTLAANVLIRKT